MEDVAWFINETGFVWLIQQFKYTAEYFIRIYCYMSSFFLFVIDKCSGGDVPRARRYFTLWVYSQGNISKYINSNKSLT